MNKRLWGRFCSVLLFAVFLSLLLTGAKNVRSQPLPPPPGPLDGVPSPVWKSNSSWKNQQIQAIYRRIRVMRLIYLHDGLGLDEKKTIQLSHILNKFDLQRLDLQRRRRGAYRALVQTQRRGASLEKTRYRIRHYFLIQQQLAQLDQQLFQAVSRLLTPSQQVQYILIMHRLQRTLQRMLRRAQRYGWNYYQQPYQQPYQPIRRYPRYPQQTRRVFKPAPFYAPRPAKKSPSTTDSPF